MMIFLELSFAFSLGGWAYVGIELLWRRRTHWSMFLTGGLCFTLLYALATLTSLPMLVQCALGALIITAVEFIVGCVVNLGLGWNVWDYSHNRFNLMGQICPAFTVLWFTLSWPAILLAKIIHLVISLAVKS